MDGLQCFDEVSVCQVGYRLAVAGLHSVLLLQASAMSASSILGMLKRCVRLRMVGYHFRSFGDEEEYRFRWLFQQLQQLVGADFVHLFG